MHRFLIGLTAVLLTACGTSYRVTADAMADTILIPNGFLPGTSFSIVPAQKGNQLLEKQMALKIAAILQNRGYIITGEGADYRLLFDYKTTHEKVTVKKAEHSPQKTETKRGFEKNDKGKLVFNESTKTSFKWENDSVEEIQYTREISISVLDGKEEVWRGSANNIGIRPDFREVLDYLLFSALGHFGRDSKKSVVTRVYEKDVVIPIQHQ